MTNGNSAERERFETEMGKDPFFWDRNLCRDVNGSYKTTEARAAWFAWQARAENKEK